jgi:hypothetical protein
MPKQNRRQYSKNGVYQPNSNHEAQLSMNDPTLRDVDEIHIEHCD